MIKTPRDNLGVFILFCIWYREPELNRYTHNGHQILFAQRRRDTPWRKIELIWWAKGDLNPHSLTRTRF